MNGGQTANTKKAHARPLNSKTTLATALATTWARSLWPATNLITLAHNIR